MKSWPLALGAIYGFLAVALGAFAAHGLADTATARELAAIETGAHYALVHAVLLAAIGLWGASRPAAGWAALAFALGVALFAGSLYGFGLTGLTAHLWITPIGGVCLLAGWACLLFAAWQSAGSSRS